MKVKYWALCFVMLLSSEFMLRISSAQKPGPVPQSRESPPKRLDDDSDSTNYCLVEPSLVLKLDQAISTIQSNVPDRIQYNNLTVESNFMVSGYAVGFKSLRVVGPYRCACGDGSFAYIVVSISFLQIFFSYTQTLTAGLSSGLLGPLGSSLAILFNSVVDLLVYLLGLNINFNVSILQQFTPGTRASISSFFIGGVNDGSFLDLRSYIINNGIEPGTAPVANLILEFILNGQVRDIFKRELEKIVFTQTDFVCYDNVRAKIEFDD